MKVLRRILIIVVSAIVGIGLLFTVMFEMMAKKTNDAVSAQINVDIDMNNVRDGIYVGEADGGMVQVEVEVTVMNHEIADIQLLKHENGKGKSAEVILKDMIQKNTDNVDAVSGATISSRTIRNAVNCALQKGM